MQMQMQMQNQIKIRFLCRIDANVMQQRSEEAKRRGVSDIEESNLLSLSPFSLSVFLSTRRGVRVLDPIIESNPGGGQAPRVMMVEDR